MMLLLLVALIKLLLLRRRRRGRDAAFVSHAFTSAATQSASVASAGSPRLRRRSASFTTGEAAHRSAFGRGHHCGTPVRVIGLPMGWLQLLLLLLLPLQTAFAACATAAAALAACPP